MFSSRSFLAKISLSFFVLLAFSLISILAEELDGVSNRGVFYPAISEATKPVYKKYETAIKEQDCTTAAKLYVKLKESEPHKVIQLENGTRTSFRGMLRRSFETLGGNGVQAFRDVFDPAALDMLEGVLKSGDMAALENLISMYEFCSCIPQACYAAAAEFADRENTCKTIFYLEKLRDIAPQEFAKPGTLSLYVNMLIKNGDVGGLRSLQAFLQANNLAGMKHNDQVILELVAKHIEKERVEREGNYEHPFGEPNMFGTPECSVTEPQIVWWARTRDDRIGESRLFVENFGQNSLSGKSTHRRVKQDPELPFFEENGGGDLQNFPAVIGDKVLLSNEEQMAVRDLTTGESLYSGITSPLMNLGSRNYNTSRQSADGFLGVSCGGDKSYSVVNCPYQLLFESKTVNGVNRLDDYSLISTPLYYRGKVYAVVESPSKVCDFKVGCFNASKREIAWRTSLFSKAPLSSGFRGKTAPVCLPAVGDGKLFVFINEIVTALDTETGEVLWMRILETWQKGKRFDSSVHFYPQFGKLLVVTEENMWSLLDANTGRILKSKEVVRSRYLGSVEGKVYLYSSGAIHVLDLKEETFSEHMLPSRITVNGGAVTKKHIYVMSEANLCVLDRADMYQISKTDIFKRNFAPRATVVPLGDNILIVTRDTIFCLRQKQKVVRYFEQMEQQDAKNPVIFYEKALINYFGGKEDEAVDLLIEAKTLNKPDREYLDKKLSMLIETALCDIYRKNLQSLSGVIDRTAMLNRGISLMETDRGKALLGQFLVVNACRGKDSTTIIDTVLAESRNPEIGRCRANKKLVEEAFKIIGASCKNSTVTLDFLYGKLIEHYSSLNEVMEICEERAEALEEKVLAGDVDSARVVFGVLKDTSTALSLAIEVAFRFLEEEAPQELEEVLKIATANIPPKKLPELYLARAVALKKNNPSIALQIAIELNEAYADRKLLHRKANHTISFYTQKFFTIPKIAVEEKLPQISGFVEVPPIGEKRPSHNLSVSPFYSSKGVVFANRDGSISCINFKERKEEWKIPVPQAYTLGARFSKDLSRGEKYKVTMVTPGLPCAIAGIQVGDVVLKASVYGEENEKKIFGELLLYPDEKRLKLTILRDYKTFEVILKPEPSPTKSASCGSVIEMYPIDDSTFLVMRGEIGGGRVEYIKHRVCDGGVISTATFPGLTRIGAPIRYGKTIICPGLGEDGQVRIEFDPVSDELRTCPYNPICGILDSVYLGNLITYHNGGIVSVEGLDGESLFMKTGVGCPPYEGFSAERNLVMAGRGTSVEVFDILAGESVITGRKCFPVGFSSVLMNQNNYFTLRNLCNRSEEFKPVFSSMRMELNSCAVEGDFAYVLIGECNDYRPERGELDSAHYKLLVKLNTRTGAIEWTQRIGSVPKNATVSVLNGIVSVVEGTKFGYTELYCYREDTGEVLLNGIRTQGSSNPQYCDGYLIVCSGYHRIYRVITSEEVTQLRERCRALEGIEAPEIKAVVKVLDALILANMNKEVVALCKHLLSAPEKKYLNIYREMFLRYMNRSSAQLFEKAEEYPLQKLKVFTADTDFAEWSEDGWIPVKSDYISVPELDCNLKETEKRSAFFQIGTIDDKLCIAVKVIAKEAENGSRDLVRFAFGTSEGTLNVPVNLKYLDVSLDSVGVCKWHYYCRLLRGRLRDGFNLQRSARRSEDKLTTWFEFAIPFREVFLDEEIARGLNLNDAETVRSLLIKLRFNIGVLHTAFKSQSNGALELAPTVFHGLNNYTIGEKLFPRLKLQEVK